jgi:hypothetical protein
MERMEYLSRLPIPKLHLAWDTFGSNWEAFRDGKVVATVDPSHATEEWRMVATFVGDRTDVTMNRTAQLQATRWMQRV